MSKKVILTVILFILNSTIMINGIDFCSEKPLDVGTAQLRHDLLCKYEKSDRPGSKLNQPVTVNLKFLLKYFTYDMFEHTLSVHNWIIMYWDDERLKWNPTDYQSLTRVYVNTDEIWTPKLSELTRSDLSESLNGFNTRCLAQSTGTVICVIPAGHNGLCVADLLYYPFDKQKCVVIYGTWADATNEVDFKFNTKNSGPISLEDLTPNSEWDLLSVEAIILDKQNTTRIIKPLFQSNYSLQRRNSIFIATIITPALILVMLVLTTTFMNFKNPDRPRIGCFNLVCHFMYVQHIFWQIPASAGKTPLIVTFFRDSMILCSTHLLLTVIFNRIIQMKSQCPNFLVNWIQKIKSNTLGRFFINSAYSNELSSADATEEDKDIPAENISPNTWLLVITLLDNITVILYIVSYLVLFLGYVLISGRE